MPLTVEGSIPSYAAGTLYRTGPGSYQVETSKGTTHSASHWFDGFSQVHRFQILASDSQDCTKVIYNSRTTVDKLIDQIRETGSLDGFTFGQKRDPCQSYFKKVMSVFHPATRVDRVDSNIGVTLSIDPPGLSSSHIDDKEGQGHASGISTLWAKTDASHLKRIDPETLEPVGHAKQSVLHPDLKGAMSGAHAKSDPVTGDVFNYNLDLGRQPTYRVFRVNASTGTTDILATITNAEAAYIHSLFLTENYVVLCVWNSYYAFGGAKILWEKNMLDSMLPFDPSKPNKWIVVDRRHERGVVGTYESPPFFAFHTINAWEERSAADPVHTDIVADLVAYDDLSVLSRFYYENLKSTAPGARAFTGNKGDASRASLRRYRLAAMASAAGSTAKPPQRAATLEWAAPKALSGELPTIDPGRATRPHRFVYGVADRGRSSFFDGLVKYDCAAGAAVHWSAPGQSPGEPIFVPDPAPGRTEDAGVLLSVVLDGRARASYLLCLDARDMTELGRAACSGPVGFGFHGAFVPATSGPAATRRSVLDF